MQHCNLTWVKGPLVRKRLVERLSELGAVQDTLSALPLIKRTQRTVPAAWLNDQVPGNPVTWLAPQVGMEEFDFVWQAVVEHLAENSSAYEMISHVTLLLPSRRKQAFIGPLTARARSTPILTRLLLAAAASEARQPAWDGTTLRVGRFAFGPGWAESPALGVVQLKDRLRPIDPNLLRLPARKTSDQTWGALVHLDIADDVQVRHFYRCLLRAYPNSAANILEGDLRAHGFDSPNPVDKTVTAETVVTTDDVEQLLTADRVDIVQLAGTLRACGWKAKRVQSLLGTLTLPDGSPRMRRIRAETRLKILHGLFEDEAEAV